MIKTPAWAGKVVQKQKIAGKKIVLIGGCFDGLHPGHLVFLEKSKKRGDYLVVLLESDQKIRRLKGLGRPIFTQADRAKILNSLRCVDLVVMLPPMDDFHYDCIVRQITPDIIATTAKDSQIKHKKRVAKLVGAKICYVTKRISGYSSSQMIGRIKNATFD